jgi:hypothetical protein
MSQLHLQLVTDPSGRPIGLCVVLLLWGRILTKLCARSHCPGGEAHLVSAFFSLSTEAENTTRCRRFRWGCWDRSGSSHVRTRLAGGIKPMQCPSSIGIKFARRNRHRDWEGDLLHNIVARRGCFAAAAPRNTVTARSVCR